MDIATNSTAARVSKADQAERAFAALYAEASRRGFFGVVTLTLHVQDGHIQQIRLGTEQLLK